MKVVIVGAGKVGYYLATTLMERGHTPVLVEGHRETCRMAADSLGIQVICGDGSTIDALQAAGAAEASGFASVTGSDEVNLVACQLARRVFGIGRTVARVNNPKNLSVMKQLGVDIPISATDNIAQLIEREVDSAAIRQLLSLHGGQATINEITLPMDSVCNGVALSELSLPEDCVILSITRGERMMIPRGKTVLRSGDVVLAMVEGEAFYRLGKALGIGSSK